MTEDAALIFTVLDRRPGALPRSLTFRCCRTSRKTSRTHGCQPPSSLRSFACRGDKFCVIRHIVSELPPVLLQVESIVCNSQAGSAPELQNYNDYWQKKIYSATVRFVQDGFKELWNLLENGPPSSL